MPRARRYLSGEKAKGMTNEELIEYVTWANDEIAQVLRAALQPVVDSF